MCSLYVIKVTPALNRLPTLFQSDFEKSSIADFACSPHFIFCLTHSSNPQARRVYLTCRPFAQTTCPY